MSPRANIPAPPTEAELSKMLGPAFKHWQSIISAATTGEHRATSQWKHYAGKLGGWRLVLKNTSRNLAYLKPESSGFLVALALSDADLDRAEATNSAPSALIAEIRSGPKFPEGRAARLQITTAAAARTAARLIAVKASR